MTLFATSFGDLDIVVFVLEAAGLALASEDFLNKCLLPIRILKPCAVVLSGAFYESSRLRELRDFEFSIVLFIMPVRVENVTHFEQLKIALQFWGQVCAGHVKPIGTGSSFLFLLVLH